MFLYNEYIPRNNTARESGIPSGRSASIRANHEMPSAVTKVARTVEAARYWRLKIPPVELTSPAADRDLDNSLVGRC